MKKVIGIIVLIIVVIVLVLVFGNKKEEADVIDQDSVTAYSPDEIRASHIFEEGTHTITGEIDLPTPCYDLTHDVRVAESFPEQVTIDFTAEADPDLMCVQVISPTPFTVIFEASQEARISARFNSQPVRLSLDTTISTTTNEVDDTSTTTEVNVTE